MNSASDLTALTAHLALLSSISFGGFPTVLPDVRNFVVATHGWMTDQDFTNFFALAQAVDLPARLAFVPDLVPREDLINAVGLNSLLFNSARAVGPAVAGLLFVLANQVTSGRDAVTLGAVK